VKARMKALTNSLERLEIDPKRLQVVEVPQGNPAKFTSVAKAFIEDIRSIGPLV
jgi:coenzyme F420-reducing hydrogenase delta subunit